ncbi:hypothetical protein ACHWQZ_G001274 [Mnemiopsis leidyi]
MAAIVKALPGAFSKVRSTMTTLIRDPQVQTGLRELAPPTPSEIPSAINSIVKTVESIQTKRFLDVTVGQAARNALVSAEVVCWFFVGEIIGRRSLVGYKVSSK